MEKTKLKDKLNIIKNMDIFWVFILFVTFIISIYILIISVGFLKEINFEIKSINRELELMGMPEEQIVQNLMNNNLSREELTILENELWRRGYDGWMFVKMEFSIVNDSNSRPQVDDKMYIYYNE